MGMALAAKRGKSTGNAKIRRLADSMTEKQLRDFAKTKHKKLPEKKAQDGTFFPALTEKVFLKTAADIRMKNGLTKKAFLSGFIKRATEYGFSAKEASSLLDKAEEGWGDLNLNRFRGSFPEVGTEHNPGIMAHLKRNAGKYIGAGIGIPLAAYINNNTTNHARHAFLAAGLPISLGTSIDALRERMHIAKLLQKSESLTHLKNLVNNRTDALRTLQGGIDEDLRRFSPAEAK
jgi:hypothetical protein